MHKTKSLCCTPETQHCKSTLLQTHTHTHTHIYINFFLKTKLPWSQGEGTGIDKLRENKIHCSYCDSVISLE